ncbi:hypothetical protein [Anaerophilus nitritogenes]|uniref:hypothetical protein n=1 Tax=Anaerophilus nitritogenes TaxID=2498136 RepID=UPI00101D2426|nr:hypothetical protein [Anaerophilus nitritogenes]
MILIFRTFYIILIGFMIYRMFKNEGCCGGHSYHRENSCDTKMNANTTSKQMITEEEKRNSIDVG